MKKFTKTICAILALALMTGLLTACPNNAKSSSQKDDRTDLTTRQTETELKPGLSEPNQTINTMDTDKEDETTEPETSSSDVTTASQTTAKTTAKPTAKPLGKVKVTDAFKKTQKTINLGKATSRIPKVTIEGVDTKKINNEILNKFKPLITKYKCSCSYQYYIGKTYVSIFIKYTSDTEWYRDDTECFVYNISRKTGKKLSRKEMLKLLKLKSKKFNARVKKAFTKTWKKMHGNYEKKYYKKAVSKKKLNTAVPYVNSKGKVCYLLKNVRETVDPNYYDHYGTC